MQRWFRHQHVIFDCDSTLSRIEGIDELAQIAGVTDEVKQMTDAAMAGEIGLEEVYGKRLELIKPKRKDILKLKDAYKNTATKDAATVVDQLHELGHDVYIVSGGLLEPVREFGLSLGIIETNIFAVGVNYNQLSGQWWRAESSADASWSPEYLDFHNSPLTLSEGKKTIITELLSGKTGRSMLIGDGMSDFLASSCVDQFVGYGGVIDRDNVRKESDVFICSESLLPLLPLCCAAEGLDQIRTTNPEIYRQCFSALENNVEFSNADLKNYLLNLHS